MKNWKYLINSARREIIRDTVAICAIIICGAVALTATCINQARAHGWTDTELCIDSYEGIIPYRVAVDGCKSRRLQGLSSEQQGAILNMPEEESRPIIEAIINQATGIND